MQVTIPPKCSDEKPPDIEPPEHDWWYYFDGQGAYERECEQENCNATQINKAYPDGEKWVDKNES